MMKQVDEACTLPCDKDELIGVFEKYHFHDEYGHPLCNCVEFLFLVSEYCQMKSVNETPDA